jgi:hypothetical protein
MRLRTTDMSCLSSMQEVLCASLYTSVYLMLECLARNRLRGPQASEESRNS